MRYRRKPSGIDAERADKLLYWFNHEWENAPDWFRDAYTAGGVVCGEHIMSIETPVGKRTAGVDHMVIRDAAGQLYPFRISIFELLFEEGEPEDEQ